jgi:nucleoside-diphosphate-sugar epimerase
VKRVIVTGATGFIGRFAVQALQARGYEVHALSRTTNERADGVFSHRVDLLAGHDVEPVLKEIRASHLLHLAWCAQPPSYWTSPENLKWVQASLILMDKFREAGGQRLVGAGTCAEYDWSYGYCVEHVTPTNPLSLYGVSKDCAQRLQGAYCTSQGISGAWGRVFHLYGPGEHPGRLVPTLIAGLLQGRAVPCTQGNQFRDYLHVSDVASAFAALLDSEVQGPVNIGSGKPLLLKDLIGKVAEIIGREDLARLGALPSPEHEPHLLVASTARLEREVSWRPALDINRGLSETVAWWRENRHSK